MSIQKRVLVALGLFAGIYALGLGTGVTLYVTDAIGTGPLHTECEGFAEEIAAEQGIPEEDVAQEDIRARAIECHEAEKAEITPEEVFRQEFLFWSFWPATIVAGMSLLWPWWTAILRRQELVDPHTEGGGIHG